MMILLTWAQERTPVHEKFWANLLAYKAHHGAELLVMAGKYRLVNNPFTEDEDTDSWWTPEVRPYLFTGSSPLAKNIEARFDIRIMPTRKNPLSGFQVVGHHRSAIFGHPRVHMKCFAAGSSTYPKIHHSTGACTVPNYSDSGAGAQAKEHHVFGFVIVEVEADRSRFHMRHVNARSKDGAFIDSARGLMVSNRTISAAPPAQALRIGDSHAHEQFEPAIQATLKLKDICQPERVLVDDIYSHSVAGHRLERDHYEFRLRASKSTKTVQDELREAYDLIKRLGATDVINSNHHLHLDEWLANTDGREDPHNLALWSALLHEKSKDVAPSFETWCRIHATLRGEIDSLPRFWRRGEACVVGDVLHDHGHEGINGSRGTPTQWKKAGCKVTTGHTHVPTIQDGHYGTGHTSDPTKHHYADVTKSSWMWANVVQDAFGKRQVVNIVPDTEGFFVVD